MTIPQSFDLVSGPHTDSWVFTLNDFNVSTTQVHAMRIADSGSKRHAVYIPAALGLFGLGDLLPELNASSPAAAASSVVSSAPSETRAEDVVQRLKQRESVIHSAARTDVLFQREAIPSADTNVGSDIGVDANSITYAELLDVTRPDSAYVSLDDTSSWISAVTEQRANTLSGDDTDSEPRVRFSPFHMDEKERANIEAVKICFRTGVTTCIPCLRPDCNAVLFNVRALAAHIHLHDIDCFYSCIGCISRFVDKSEADEHRRTCASLNRECSSPPPHPTASGSVLVKSILKFLRMALWR